jgi:hypothetical protein
MFGAFDPPTSSLTGKSASICRYHGSMIMRPALRITGACPSSNQKITEQTGAINEQTWRGECLSRIDHHYRTPDMAVAGYSGTPLGKKLSLKPGMRVWFNAMPASVRADIDTPGLIELIKPHENLDVAHIFVTDRADMQAKLTALRVMINPAGFIWVSWPKKASKVPTDITEDTIRAVILPATDLVDVKVCAVDAVWSGLKLMIRKSAR